jgi:putative transposase
MIRPYGVVIDHIFFWDDALRPWIHARDPADSKHPRKFTFRVIPRDMREIYFRDPANNTYIAIPYRDRTRPPVVIPVHVGPANGKPHLRA